MVKGEGWPPGLWNLECVDIEPITHDVKSFHFKPLAGTNGTAPFCFHRPGQFITLRLRFRDRLVPRSYTISSPPSRPLGMSITIKRDPAGLVSRFMHDRFRIGDILPVNGPSGSFDLVSVAPKRRIVMLSGGSGITPMMSMLRYLYDTRAAQHEVTFLHSARTPRDIIFHRELELIAASSATRLLFACERDGEDGMIAGYLDRPALLKAVPDIKDCTVLTCGPAPYMRAVRSILDEIGFDPSQYHQESFGDRGERDNPPGASPENLTIDSVTTPDAMAETREQRSPPPYNGVKSDLAEITFTVSGKTVPYSQGQTILDVATRAGIAVSTNCQMGLCGTCKARCFSGRVDMDYTEGLTSEDVANGMVLTCCGRPQGPISIAL